METRRKRWELETSKRRGQRRNVVESSSWFFHLPTFLLFLPSCLSSLLWHATKNWLKVEQVHIELLSCTRWRWRSDGRARKRQKLKINSIRLKDSLFSHRTSIPFLLLSHFSIRITCTHLGIIACLRKNIFSLSHPERTELHSHPALCLTLWARDGNLSTCRKSLLKNTFS